MAYQIRRSQDRGYFDHGWLRTFHTFSFGGYYDTNHMGFRALRVINEDRIAPGRGFPTHGHQDMEIMSIVLEGELGHQDSMGHESVIHPNEIQIMSAGTGITHSEYNPSETQPVHFYQIWIIPDKQGITPRYDQEAHLPKGFNEWKLLASKKGVDDSLIIHQDVNLFAASLKDGHSLEKNISPQRYGWLQVMEGELKYEKEILKVGDGVAFERTPSIVVEAIKPSKVLFFDLN
jgi:quercetin 2,3-dioxygenase